MDVIALNPVEQKRDPRIREPIVYRDKFCTFPFLVGEQLEGLYVTAPAKYGNVHHITPLSFLQRHRPNVEPNHPLNLITLDRERHNFLHREWIKRYGNPEMVKQAVIEQAKAGWVDRYDEALTNIATIRSYDLVQSEPEYFEPFHYDIESLYRCIDGDFLDRYYYFSSKAGL